MFFSAKVFYESKTKNRVLRMSKLGCTCGHVIRDNTDYLPHKASFIPDKLDYQMLDEIKKRIENYKKN